MRKGCISVIIPVYNCEKYLETCIDSVINQTYKDLQIILIDDGSTDQSSNICDKYAKTDSRIEVYHTKNQGVSAARNYGLSKVYGEYISFIDADDFLEITMYDTIIKNFDNKTEIIICNFSIIKENLKNNSNDIPNITLQKNACIKELLLNRYLIGALWNKVFRYNIIKDIRFNEKFAIGEDLLFQYNLIKNIESAKFISERLYNYRVSQNNATNKSSYEKWLQFIDVTKIILEDIKNNYIELLEYGIIKYINSNIFILNKITINSYKDMDNVRVILDNIKENKKIYIKSKSVSIKNKIKLYAYIIKYKIILKKAKINDEKGWNCNNNR